jgi:hypothetical protein
MSGTCDATRILEGLAAHGPNGAVLISEATPLPEKPKQHNPPRSGTGIQPGTLVPGILAAIEIFLKAA